MAFRDVSAGCPDFECHGRAVAIANLMRLFGGDVSAREWADKPKSCSRCFVRDMPFALSMVEGTM